MTCHDRHDRMMVFVTGGLDPDEQREMRAHVDGGCPTCAGAVAEADAIVGLLTLASDPVTPSPSVVQRLMARVHADLQGPPPPPPPPPPAAPRPTPRAPAAPRTPWGRPRIPWEWLGTDWGRVLLVGVLASLTTYLIISTPFTRRGQSWKDNYEEKARESREYRQQLEAARREIERLESERQREPRPPPPQTD